MWKSHIIVQAGGKGTRLEHLTANRPKCLVPVENKPMIFHLFESFPKAKFIIIGDSHYNTLEKYLHTYATVDYVLIPARGHCGTLSGIKEALAFIPDQTSFILIWSDLVLPKNVHLPEYKGNYICMSPHLRCRWKFEDGIIIEEPSSEYGIAGMFLFDNKEFLGDVPKAGQLVAYLASIPQQFNPWFIPGIREFGLLEEYERLDKPKCRPFNSINFENGKVIKTAINAKGEYLARKEALWYREAKVRSVSIPEIYTYYPLTMEMIEGDTIADTEFDNLAARKNTLYAILERLRKLHSDSVIPIDMPSYHETYIDKTFLRLQEVRDLVPFANEAIIHVNGMECRNPLFHREKAMDIVNFFAPNHFHFIHGDPTFSNIMLTKNGEIFFIDPRGYFGRTALYGDIAYDYAKLYYSLKGNYDNFNKKRFRLKIGFNEVQIFIESAAWEYLEHDFYAQLPSGICPEQIRFLHSLIWLGLTTYAWEDYDAICGAYYMGTLLFEEALHERNI